MSRKTPAKSRPLTVLASSYVTNKQARVARTNPAAVPELPAFTAAKKSAYAGSKNPPAHTNERSTLMVMDNPRQNARRRAK